MPSSSRSSEPDAGPRPSGYEVRLPAFQGPVALLLSLIESERLEITAISLAAVADQYLAHLQALEERNPGELADFVAIAARLLVLKSRALLPAAPVADDEEDVAGSLIERLQEYRRFRDAARWLGTRLATGLSSYAREPDQAPLPTTILRPQSARRLLLAIRRLLPAAGDDGGLDSLGAPLISLASKVKLILRRILERGEVVLGDLIGLAHSRSEVVATFLAALELVRRGRVSARQDGLFGPITLVKATRQQPAQQEGPESLEQVC